MKLHVNNTIQFECSCGRMHGPIIDGDTVFCQCGIDYHEFIVSALTVSCRILIPFVRPKLEDATPALRGLNPDE